MGCILKPRLYHTPSCTATGLVAVHQGDGRAQGEGAPLKIQVLLMPRRRTVAGWVELHILHMTLRLRQN